MEICDYININLEMHVVMDHKGMVLGLKEYKVWIEQMH